MLFPWQRCFPKANGTLVFNVQNVCGLKYLRGKELLSYEWIRRYWANELSLYRGFQSLNEMLSLFFITKYNIDAELCASLIYSCVHYKTIV